MIPTAYSALSPHCCDACDSVKIIIINHKSYVGRLFFSSGGHGGEGVEDGIARVRTRYR